MGRVACGLFRPKYPFNSMCISDRTLVFSYHTYVQIKSAKLTPGTFLLKLKIYYKQINIGSISLNFYNWLTYTVGTD